MMAATSLSLLRYLKPCGVSRSLDYAWHCRPYSTAVPHTMSAWQISKYGSVEDLYLSADTPTPAIRRPDEVLIEVHAASVNPIDVMMMGGYGSATLNPLRKLLCNTSRDRGEFPLTLGRDFSGTVVKTGIAVPSQVRFIVLYCIVLFSWKRSENIESSNGLW